MKNTPGYHGRYLRIDVTDRTATEVGLDESVLRRFVGGVGLGTWILLHESEAMLDPLGPQAPLVFSFSPLVGSPLTTSAKFAVVAKSPLTQRLNDSLASSHFAIAGKRTGFDAIVLVGAAREPVFVTVDDGQVAFHAAEHAWGLSSEETSQVLSQDLDRGFRIAAIGIAGENAVRFATISHDGRHAGRGGAGAVMGSKCVKALAVRGTRVTKFAAPSQLVDYSRELSQLSLGPGTEKYRELGTVSNLATFNRLGVLPTRNFQQSEFPVASRMIPEPAGSESTEQARIRNSCAACNIGCEHVFERPGHKQGVRLEYESVFALGPLCGVSEHAKVVEAAALCDELGLDTISAGGTIAFAMECAERGLLDETQLRFGNADAILELLPLIARREGLGAILAEGSRRAAAEIGQGSIAFAAQVKGLEIPGYDPRGLQTMALGFAVGTRGADHNRSGAYQVDFSEAVDRLNADESCVAPAIAVENESAVMDSLILCKFIRGALADRWQGMTDMLRLTTGWEMTPAELQSVANRIMAAKKLFNIRQGWTPEEDTLPERFFEQAVPEGASAGARLDRRRLRQCVRLYNQLRGWGEDGTAVDLQSLV